MAQGQCGVPVSVDQTGGRSLISWIDIRIARQCLHAYWVPSHPAAAIVRGKVPVPDSSCSGLHSRGGRQPAQDCSAGACHEGLGEHCQLSRQHPQLDNEKIRWRACIFWLKNRQPERWRDRVKVQHQDGRIGLIGRMPTDEEWAKRAGGDPMPILVEDNRV